MALRSAKLSRRAVIVAIVVTIERTKASFLEDVCVWEILFVDHLTTCKLPLVFLVFSFGASVRFFLLLASASAFCPSLKQSPLMLRVVLTTLAGCAPRS